LVSSHPHVVAFMGVAKDADHLYLVYEYTRTLSSEHARTHRTQ
jgi:hypothetical protein